MKYRPEIDGLRAIAVVPVILFHAGFTWFDGGFVGVDVFFVISGYLITTIIWDEMKAGRFSIANFYERRARRILPALFFMLAVTLPFAHMWMFPSQLEDFGETVMLTLAFSSNFVFLRGDEYFGTAAEMRPLLHTWSLAVEEQFYIFFPFLLLFLRRWQRPVVIWGLIGVFLASFVLAEWGSRNEPGGAFYFLPTRIWELLAGALCVFVPRFQSAKLNNPLGLVGLALICVAVVSYDDSILFPGIYALLPVGGTVMIILFAREGSWAAKLLSLRGLVAVGLISYSTYLWHQPLFAFARLRSFHEPSTAYMTTLVVVSLMMGWASTRWIEAPFRRREGRLLPQQRQLFQASAMAAGLIFAVGLSAQLSDGYGNRGEGQLTVAELDHMVRPNHGLHRDCRFGFTDSANCYTDPEPEILLWGDSYAQHLTDGILASEPEARLQLQSLSACAPILGVAQRTRSQGEEWARRCIEFNEEVLEWLGGQQTVKTVILASPFGAVVESDLLLASGKTERGSLELAAQKMRETLAAIRATGAKVMVVAPPPKSGWDIGQCLVKSVYFGAERDICDFSFEEEARPYQMLKLLSDKVGIYWLPDDICEQGTCFPLREGTFLYKDGGHLSVEGSALLGRTNDWMPTFEQLAW
ncbi:MAG: acyltransferase family protein [Celeribacter sp.]|jgi:peptidoglycan/LPS O-acetylase OafA/YrhL